MTYRVIGIAVVGAFIGAVIGVLLCAFVLPPNAWALGAIVGSGSTAVGYVAGAAVGLWTGK